MNFAVNLDLLSIWPYSNAMKLVMLSPVEVIRQQRLPQLQQAQLVDRITTVKACLTDITQLDALHVNFHIKTFVF
jgi:hypothetical protein